MRNIRFKTTYRPKKCLLPSIQPTKRDIFILTGEVKTASASAASASASKPKPPDVEKQLEAVQAHIEDLEVTNRFPKRNNIVLMNYFFLAGCDCPREASRAGRRLHEPAGVDVGAEAGLLNDGAGWDREHIYEYIVQCARQFKCAINWFLYHTVHCLKCARL